MMRYVPLILAGAIALFALQSLGRTLYIDHTEFQPAVAEWNAAHDRGDRAGMAAAWEKEWKAHERTFDPFWFLP
jgi:hypothetical protein